MRSSRGFTLIELLVVIAIIGILSSVIMVGLSQARQKSQNARVKSQLSQLRTAAEIYYQSNTNPSTGQNIYNSTGRSISRACLDGLTYTGMFGDTTYGVKELVKYQNYPGTSVGDIACDTTWNNGGAQTYAVSVKLPLQEGNYAYWCVDSRGVLEGRTAAQGHVPAILDSTVSVNCDS